jgi:hypothetical protein
MCVYRYLNVYLCVFLFLCMLCIHSERDAPYAARYLRVYVYVFSYLFV